MGHDTRMEDHSPDDPFPPITVKDKRHRASEQEGSPVGGSEDAERHPSFVVELKEKALAAESKLAEALNLLRRREAEAEDFRARLRREMERRARTERESWLKEMLEVVDSLDRGIGSARNTPASDLSDGLLKVRDQCLSVLARHGVKTMSLAGTSYDPHLAEAVAVSPASDPADDSKVLEEIRAGYTLDGQVLRPAQVRVARYSPDPPSRDEATRLEPEA